MVQKTDGISLVPAIIPADMAELRQGGFHRVADAGGALSKPEGVSCEQGESERVNVGLCRQSYGILHDVAPV